MMKRNIKKDIKKLIKVWEAIPEVLDEDDIPALSRRYEYVSTKFLLNSIGMLSAFSFAILVGLSTTFSPLMVLFASVGLLCMFKWIEFLQDKTKIHRNIIYVVSKRGRVPYDEVLVKLDLCGASIKLSNSCYKSYKQHWETPAGQYYDKV